MSGALPARTPDRVAKREPSTAGISPRITIAAAGVILVLAGAWFAASWIDTAYDATCGAAIYPGMWLEDDAPAACRLTMMSRSVIAGVAVITGLALVGLGCSRRRTLWRHANRVLALAVLGSGALIFVNEVVRSDGAF